MNSNFENNVLHVITKYLLLTYCTLDLIPTLTNISNLNHGPQLRASAAMIATKMEISEAGTQSEASGATANSLPVFVHQADAPLIMPPAGLAGAPARGLALSRR